MILLNLVTHRGVRVADFQRLRPLADDVANLSAFLVVFVEDWTREDAVNDSRLVENRRLVRLFVVVGDEDDLVEIFSGVRRGIGDGRGSRRENFLDVDGLAEQIVYR